MLQKLKISITSERNNESVNHYLHTKNHIPPWIMITNIPFGLAIEWYGILKEDDKTNICNQFIYPNPSASQLLSQDVKEFFRKALMLLREYRNKIAHGHRIFTVNSSIELPKDLYLHYVILLFHHQNTHMEWEKMTCMQFYCRFMF